MIVYYPIHTFISIVVKGELWLQHNNKNALKTLMSSIQRIQKQNLCPHVGLASPTVGVMVGAAIFTIMEGAGVPVLVGPIVPEGAVEAGILRRPWDLYQKSIALLFGQSSIDERYSGTVQARCNTFRKYDAIPSGNGLASLPS
jgi:hypothetical protein